MDMNLQKETQSKYKKIKIIEEELAKILVEARKDIEKLGKYNNKQ